MIGRAAFLPAMFLALGGCNVATHTKQSFHSPRGDYTVLIDKADLGGCCKTYITGHISGFAPDDPAEIFEIRGSQEVSVAWKSPYALVATVCDASKITYQTRLWNEDGTNSLRIEVVNRPAKPPGDRQICE
jgi:hypothetical protein